MGGGMTTIYICTICHKQHTKAEHVCSDCLELVAHRARHRLDEAAIRGIVDAHPNAPKTLMFAFLDLWSEVKCLRKRVGAE